MKQGKIGKTRKIDTWVLDEYDWLDWIETQPEYEVLRQRWAQVLKDQPVEDRYAVHKRQHTEGTRGEP